MIFRRNRNKEEIEAPSEVQSQPEPDAKSVNYVAELKAKEKNEPIASLFRMRLVELTPGYAKVSMKLSGKYTNFNGLVFGGVIASVADQAFAYASNSVSMPSIASQFNIHFVGTADVNDELTAECWVVRNGKRVGVSEMTVTNQEGKIIAKATGTTIPIRDGI